MMSKKIRKAVFPAAGLGSRFLPVTKVIPKEMLPIVDKPLIHYAVEEAVAAGMTELIFITGRTKQSVVDYFDKAYELENELQKKNKTDLLQPIQNILPKHVHCIYLRQAEPLGLGDAILSARSAVGDEPFAVLLADDLIRTTGAGCLAQMMDIFARYHRSIIAVENILREKTNEYGIISTRSVDQQVGELDGIVEKPEPDKARSTQAVIGRYILTPGIFDLLEETDVGVGGELQLTDAIAALLKKESVYSYAFTGKRYDCGTKMGYLIATVDYALQHEQLGPIFADYLASQVELADKLK